LVAKGGDVVNKGAAQHAIEGAVDYYRYERGGK
jgi:hypothetical protein